MSHRFALNLVNRGAGLLPNTTVQPALQPDLVPIWGAPRATEPEWGAIEVYGDVPLEAAAWRSAMEPERPPSAGTVPVDNISAPPQFQRPVSPPIPLPAPAIPSEISSAQVVPSREPEEAELPEQVAPHSTAPVPLEPERPAVPTNLTLPSQEDTVLDTPTPQPAVSAAGTQFPEPPAPIPRAPASIVVSRSPLPTPLPSPVIPASISSVEPDTPGDVPAVNQHIPVPLESQPPAVPATPAIAPPVPPTASPTGAEPTIPFQPSIPATTAPVQVEKPLSLGRAVPARDSAPQSDSLPIRKATTGVQAQPPQMAAIDQSFPIRLKPRPVRVQIGTIEIQSTPPPSAPASPPSSPPLPVPEGFEGYHSLRTYQSWDSY